MRFNRGARLDTSQVRDRRGMAPMALGGGGLIGVVLLVFQLLAGGGGDPSSFDLGTRGAGDSADNPSSDLAAECRTGDDANQKEDCRIVAVVNSVQAHWSEGLEGYREAPTVFFNGQVSTGCGGASSAVGPFYCPTDTTIYIDLGFYDDLRTKFGAKGGVFAEAYVIAHEYGHHVENLLGVFEKADRSKTGPDSDAVKMELMADCLAGAWAGGAVETGFIEELTEADIRDGLDAAAAIGDDRIQEQTQGQVSPEAWTHGSSEQRQQAFLGGYRNGTLENCNTFA